MEYTIQEYCDMCRIIDECRDNANTAARLYRERYRDCVHPTANVIRRLDQSARESGQSMCLHGVAEGNHIDERRKWKKEFCGRMGSPPIASVPYII
ncbi:hypothetical protein PR048_005148 [Dryococelus australis]|uniref:DUF4817 domain-containing protein n=1 Tax=Dryococelus australis TaxID=614101 RepID=A0ABQ9I7V2_9NEOP|nr:hypothetical protein PR048_005148 [Dryococelus australis]